MQENMHVKSTLRFQILRTRTVRLTPEWQIIIAGHPGDSNEFRAATHMHVKASGEASVTSASQIDITYPEFRGPFLQLYVRCLTCRSGKAWVCISGNRRLVVREARTKILTDSVSYRVHCA
jgi:hypothetical protein